MQTFTSRLAAFLKKRVAAGTWLKEAMDDGVESSRTKPTRDKLIKRALENVTWKIISQGTKGPEFLDWLDKVFEQVADETARQPFAEHALMVDRIDLDEEPFVVSGRFLGDTQDPDMEVPARLSNNAIATVLNQMGGKPVTVNWNIREADDGVRRDLHTVYTFRATFPMKTLAVEMLGRPAVEAAADAALGAAHSTKLKTPRQLDAEIAAALAKKSR